jgi:uncharacterized membrane protein
MMWGYADGGWWIAMMIWMVLFWGIVIAGGAWLISSLTARRDREESPEDVLARRLAQGEIDREEYRALKDELRGRRQGPTSA